MIQFVLWIVSAQRSEASRYGKIDEMRSCFCEKNAVRSSVIQGDWTHNNSERIFEKIRFEILSEGCYENYKQNEEVVFKDMGNEKSVRLYGKFVC